MSKFPGKNAIILINGYNFSTYASAFDTEANTNPIEVTGFTDGCKNFIPGMNSATVLADMFWDSTAGSVHAALGNPQAVNGNVTILPEGYTLGASSINLPFTQANYSPKGTPDSALTVGTLNFISYGDNAGLEYGNVLTHGTITNTTTSTAFLHAADAVTADCAGTLHIWTAPAADRYVVKIQHCATEGGVYADLVTFTLDGSAVAAERVAVASGTINKYVKVVATRTGAGNNPFGFTVHFWKNA
jgi:hypothetical protein